MRTNVHIIKFLNLSEKQQSEVMEGLGNEYFYENEKLMKITTTGKKSGVCELLQVDGVRFNQ